MIYVMRPISDGPIDFSKGPSDIGIAVKSSDGRWWRQNVPPDRMVEFTEKMTSITRQYLNASSVIQTDDFKLAQRYAYTYVISPTEFDAPDDRISMSNVKEGYPHTDFKKRSLAGEILVSDYKRGSAIVRQSAGYVAGNPSKGGGSIGAWVLESSGLLVLSSETGLYHLAGSDFVINTSNVLTFHVSVGNAPGQWVFHPSVSATDALQAAGASFDLESDEVKSLVTQTLARANRSAVDVLTAAAELPKSISSVISGFKTVAGITKDLKKKQFSLSEASKRRSRQITKQYEKRLARIRKELSSGKLSAKRRKALESHLTETRVKMRTALLGTSDELASALADVWLNYRYNIMPNVYLAQDVWEAHDKFGREFTTSRGTRNSSSSIELAGVRMDVDHTVKCMIKRSYSELTASQGRSVISNDIFVTAWELVPLSFVYDWFINFGDLLSAQSYNYGWKDSGNTLSFKTSFDAELDIPMKQEFVIEPRTAVRGSLYQRIVINPHSLCGLVWQPSVGLERKLDLISLAWRPVRSLLHKGKQR